MSFRWPNKDPDEQLDYSIDWSRFLGDSITITGVQWSVDAADGTKTTIAGGATVNGIQNVSQSHTNTCLLYTSPSPRDGLLSRMPSSA